MAIKQSTEEKDSMHPMGGGSAPPIFGKVKSTGCCVLSAPPGQFADYQSPIHIRNEKAKPLPEDLSIHLTFSPDVLRPEKLNRPQPKHNTIIAEAAAESVLRIDDGMHHYEGSLQQFHTHFPGEHKIDGKSYDGEVHFVFTDANGQLAVVGVLVKEGKANKALQDIVDTMELDAKGPLRAVSRMLKHTFEAVALRKQANKKESILPVQYQALLPNKPDVFYTRGSLTAPANDGSYAPGDVQWLVFEEPIEASKKQLQTLSRAIGADNHRPLQPERDREVFKGQISSAILDLGQRRQQDLIANR